MKMRLHLLRPMVFRATAVYFIALALLGSLFLLAAPAPNARVVQQVGVGLPGVNQWPRFWVSHSILLTGRRLRCTTVDNAVPRMQECTMRLVDKPLVIRAQPKTPSDPHQFGGTCEVFYAGKEISCSVGTDIVRTVYLSTSLDLTPRQLTLLRLRHPIENLREDFIFRGIFVVSILTTLVAVLAYVAWLWPPGNRLLFFLALPLPAALFLLVTFVVSLIVTGPFWD